MTGQPSRRAQAFSSLPQSPTARARRTPSPSRVYSGVVARDTFPILQSPGVCCARGTTYHTSVVLVATARASLTLRFCDSMIRAATQLKVVLLQAASSGLFSVGDVLIRAHAMFPIPDSKTRARV